MSRAIVCLVLLAGCSMSTSAANAGYVATVNAQDGPWLYSSTLNSSFQYGAGDQSAPVVINAADGFSFAAGGVFTIQYLSGTTSAGNGYAFVDAGGNTAYPDNDNLAANGTYAPSRYMNPASYPIYLSELVGTFANSQGVIVGTPFAIGDSLSIAVPVGATQLQLGINDVIYSDNVGSLTELITGPATVPEPSAVILTGLGLAGVAASRLMRRKRACPAA